MSRTFVVTAIEGKDNITGLGDPGSRFLSVMVTADNAAGETIQFRRPLDQQPHVGDTVTFEEIPDGAIMAKDGP